MKADLADQAVAAASAPWLAINPRVPGPVAELVEAFRTVAVANASDCMGRSVGAMGLQAITKTSVWVFADLQ